jgi:hypothetical protein
VKLILVNLGLEFDLFETRVVFNSRKGLFDDAHEIDVSLIDLKRLVLHLGKVQEVQHEDSH